MRTHIVMPEATIHAIDRLVGRRSRGRFLAEAAEEKLRRLQQRIALDEVAGSLKDADIAAWETPESASAWVREIRAADDRRLQEQLRDH